MRATTVLALAGLLLVAASAWAGTTTTDVGRFGSKGNVIQFGVTRGSASLNGASLHCYDEYIIQSVYISGLSRKDLEQLRALVDATIAELGK